MSISKPRADATAWMSGTYSHSDLKFDSAVVKERISTLTEIQVEFVSLKAPLDLSSMVGQNLTVHILAEDLGRNGRMFTGTCISVQTLGFVNGADRYIAEVRPWFWMLTLTRNNRVFQNKTAVQVIEEVLEMHGFSSKFKIDTSGTCAEREYCVQYRETDFDFLSRLMEEEGLFYYFNHNDAFEKDEELVICDGVSGLGSFGVQATIPFRDHGVGSVSREAGMHKWAQKEAVVRGKVSLGDYDFEVPSVAQMAVKQNEKGNHGHKSYEFYDLPGHYRDDQNVGEKFAEVRLGADTAKHIEYEGTGTHRTVGSGFTLTLEDHLRDELNDEYLIVGAEHRILDPLDSRGKSERRQVVPFTEERDDYSFKIDGILKSEQYRAPMVTPWPEVPGVQTGVVVGPEGEEIYTDEHGRIRVHFRWDRVNGKDDGASCWIRVATPWSGKNWGINYVPRIGQEVLIQFEDGDPDRPIVTGMLYNAETMPPYVDAGQPTQTGIQTRSSPKGGANDYNALVFEDKAGSEFTHFQSQKDYQMVVKDSAQITIGDDSVNVSKSGQSVDAGSLLQTIEQNVSEVVKKGDKTAEVKKGDYTDTISMGDYKMEVKLGKITMEAAQSITFIVGQTKIEMTQTGIVIDAPLTATMKAGASATVQSSGSTTVKGSVVMIN